MYVCMYVCSNTVPSHARYIAGRSHDRSLDASKEASVLQPAGADQQLAGTAPSRTEVTPTPLGRPSELGTAADRSAGTAKSSVTDDNVNRPDLLPDDSGYGPSLWTAELGTPDGSRTEAVGAKRYNPHVQNDHRHNWKANEGINNSVVIY